MRPGRLWRLARGNLAREIGALLVSAGGVALGIGCLVFFLALGRGVRKVVGDVFPVSTREVEVVVPYLRGDLVNRVHTDGKVLAEEHTADGTRLHALVRPALAAELARVTPAAQA